MPDARLLVVIFAFLISLTPALAIEETEKLVVGVSPASQVVCVPAGGRATAIYMISTNIEITQNVTVFSESEWISGEPYVYVTQTFDYPLTVSVPKGTPEGEYNLKFEICRLPDERLNESITSVACLLPSIAVNVSSGCSVEEKPNGTISAAYAIILAIIVLAAIFVVRQVSNIKRGKIRKK